MNQGPERRSEAKIRLQVNVRPLRRRSDGENRLEDGNSQWIRVSLLSSHVSYESSQPTICYVCPTVVDDHIMSNMATAWRLEAQDSRTRRSTSTREVSSIQTLSRVLAAAQPHRCSCIQSFSLYSSSGVANTRPLDC